MTKEELAELFAEQKKEELTTLIKEAYLKGYEQGQLGVSVPIFIDGVEYVDLGMPSGTLWSKEPLTKNGSYLQVSYSEAMTLPIPTREQWEELNKTCAFKNNKIVAPLPTCQRIGFEYWRKGLQGEECDYFTGYKFWLKGEIDSLKHAPVMVYCVKDKEKHGIEYRELSKYFRNDRYLLIGSDKHFTGYKLPVFLVKNKE